MSLIKKRENMPYTSLEWTFKEKQSFEERYIMTTGLNMYIDNSNGSLFGHLMPLGSVESPTVAIFS